LRSEVEALANQPTSWQNNPRPPKATAPNPPNESGRLCACGCRSQLDPDSAACTVSGHQFKLPQNGAVRGALVTRRYPRPPTPLGEFLRDKWRDSDRSGRAFSQLIGFSEPKIVTAYIEGSHPKDAALATLQR